MSITLNQVPGFVDIPLATLDAEDYAVGLPLQRANGNAKFGLVRLEIFVDFYRHGDTVNLPTSTVDGYTYSRDELRYLWCYAHTSSDGKGIRKGTIWYFGCKVDQLSGEVTTEIKYRESETLSTAQMTNDGILRVTTIAVRRLASLSMTAAASFVNHSDFDYALDLPLRTTPLKDLVAASKFVAVSTEAIYLGEFVHGNVIAQPVSPVDGHIYAYADVKFAYSWRWTTQGDAFVDPVSVSFGWLTFGLNQLNRIRCSIDATGHVTLNVDHTQDGDQLTNNGRITVVALCQRPRPASSLANQFVDVADDYFGAGTPLRDDALVDLNQNIHYAACRPEIFESVHSNGQYVPVPVSPIDGYTYSRDELVYLAEWKDQAPTSEHRIITTDLMVAPTTGLVTLQISHMHRGGAAAPSNDGTAKVWTLAMRGHVANPDEDIALVTGGSEADAEGFSNPGFDQWTTPTQQLADDWTVQEMISNCTGSRVPGLSGSPSAQRVHVPVGDGIGILSSKAAVKPKDLRYLSVGCQATAGSGTSVIRLRLYNKDRRSSVYADIYVAPFTGALEHHDFWFEVPDRGATQVVSSRGLLWIAGLALAITNPDFETSAALPPVGYWASAGALVAFNSLTPYAGTRSVRITNNGTATYEGMSQPEFPVSPGTNYRLTAAVKNLSGASDAQIQFMDAAGVYISSVSIPGAGLGVWNYATADAIAPVNAATAHLWLQAGNANGVSAEFDAVSIVATALDFLPAYAAVELICWNAAVAMSVDWDDVVWGVQQNPAAGEVASLGSSSLAFFPAIHYTFPTTTSVDFDLTFPINRVDGSTSVALNAGHILVTGLLENTAYALEAYFDEKLKTFEAMATGHGSNGWAYHLSELTRDLAVGWAASSHLPLSDGPIYFTTPVTGAPPGGGGYGGGDSGCPMVDVFVKERTRGIIRAGEVKLEGGDEIWGPTSDEGEFHAVERNEIKAHEEWALVDFSNGVRGLQLTTGSAMRSSIDDAQVRVCELTFNSWIPSPTGSTAPTKLERKREQNFKAKISLREAPNLYYVSVDGVHWLELHNLRATETT